MDGWMDVAVIHFHLTGTTLVTPDIDDGKRSRKKPTPVAYLWLFGMKPAVPLLQLHVQAFIGAAIHLRDGRRGGRADVAVIPAPVAAAAAVGELAAAALHVGG